MRQRPVFHCPTCTQPSTHPQLPLTLDTSATLTHVVSPPDLPQVELQRIRVRQRHDPRFNGNQEDAAQFGMTQLKGRNSKNRDLDVL